MNIRTGVLSGIAALGLFVGIAYAQQGSSQQSDPAMQQSGSSSSQMDQQSMTKDTQMVKKVQQALSTQGYDPGPSDGKWGSKTEKALKKYQKEQGLNANGQLDQQTLASLGVQSGAAAGGQEDMSSGSQSGTGGGQDMPSDSGSGAGGGQQDGSGAAGDSTGGQQPGSSQDQQSGQMSGSERESSR